jgi:PGF-CTERM protein
MRPLVVLVALFAVTAPLVGVVGVGAVAPAESADAGSDADADADAAADLVTITVVAVDQNGDGISGATVTATWDGGNDTATTRASGESLLDVPDDKRVEIGVTHPEFVRNVPKTFTNVNGDQRVSIEMTPPSNETVTVLDGDGNPVEDARVTLFKDGQFQSAAMGRTDANGQYTATGIEEGTYEISVRRSGYDRAYEEAQIAGDSSDTVDVVENSSQIRFRITDGRLDEGIEATVTIQVSSSGREIRSGLTGDSGRVTLPLPVNTDYTVVVTREGYDEVRQAVSVNQRDRTVALTINRTDNLSLSVGTSRVLAGNTVEVTVTDEYDERVEGATIRADGEAVATTGADGVASVRLADVGNYELVADDGDVESGGVTVRAAEAATTTAPPTSTQPPTTAPPTSTQPPTTQPPTPTATGTDAPTDTESDDDGGGSPGFAVGAALAGLLGALLMLRRRR